MATRGRGQGSTELLIVFAAATIISLLIGTDIAPDKADFDSTGNIGAGLQKQVAARDPAASEEKPGPMNCNAADVFMACSGDADCCPGHVCEEGACTASCAHQDCSQTGECCPGFSCKGQGECARACCEAGQVPGPGICSGCCYGLVQDNTGACVSECLSDVDPCAGSSLNCCVQSYCIGDENYSQCWPEH